MHLCRFCRIRLQNTYTFFAPDIYLEMCQRRTSQNQLLVFKWLKTKGCWNTCSWVHYRAAFSAPCGQNATISVIVSVQWFHVPHLPSALKASGSKNKEEKEKNLIYKWIRQSTLKKTATHTLKKCCIQMERDSSVSVIQCSTASSLCLYFTDIKNREYQFFILNMSLQLSNLHKKNSKTMFEVKSRCCFLLQRRFNEPASQFYFAYPQHQVAPPNTDPAEAKVKGAKGFYLW